MPSNVFEDIINADMPNLETLDLNLGVKEHGYELSIEELRNFINSLIKFKKIRHLGICNTENTLEVIKIVSDSKIISQLESLDFSKGVLYDVCGEFIIDHFERFSHLKRIELEYNYFTGDILDKLHNLPIKLNTFEGLVKDPYGEDKPYYCE